MSENELEKTNVSEPVESANPTSGMDNFQKKNKRSKWKFIIISVLVLVAVGIGLFVGYTKLTSNPVAIYKKAINDLYELANKNLLEANKSKLDINPTKDPFTINLDAKFSSSIPELKPFEGIRYNVSLGLDYANKEGSVALGLSNKNNEVLKLLASVIDEKAYLSSDDLIDKVLELGDYDIFSEIDLDALDEIDFSLKDADTLLKEYKDILISYLDKDKFTMSNETVTLYGKKQKTKKITYKVDEKELQKLTEHILTETSKNTKILDIISNLSNTSVSELKDALKEIDVSELTFDGELEIVVYADAWNNIVGITFSYDDTEYVRYEAKGDEYKITIEAEAEKILLEGNDKDLKITAYEAKEKIFTLTYSYSKDIKITLDVDYEGTTINGTIELKNMKSTNKSLSSDIKLDFKASFMNQDYSFTFDGSYSIEKGEIDVVNPKNSIYYEDLSEEDVMKMYTNLQNIVEELDLTDLMESFS